jgi:FkbM family methyltransferase
LRSVLDEVVSVHRAFGNWLPLLGSIALGRAKGRPPALRMRVRRGPTLHAPGGDRSWWTAVECFGRDCYGLTTVDLPLAPAVVDIGANIGAFALAVLTARPQAQIAAYEPSPAALAMLRTNVAANDARAHVTVHHGAVTGPTQPDTVWLNEQVGDLCTSSVLDQGDAVGASTRRVEVPAIPLTAILSSYPHDIDLLKLDVEGAEYGIVEETPVELLAKVRHMVVEYHDVPGRDVRELANRLRTAGLVWERQEHSVLPGQGLAWWARPEGRR